MKKLVFVFILLLLIKLLYLILSHSYIILTILNRIIIIGIFNEEVNR